MSKIIQDVNLGLNLKRLRESKKLTQADVFARMELMGRPVSQPLYSMIENGTRNIFVSDLMVLKEIFDVEYDEFFQGLSPINKYEENK